VVGGGAGEAAGGSIGDYDGAVQLGKTVAAPTSPFTATLDRVPNAHVDALYVARFVCPEFTSYVPTTKRIVFKPILRLRRARF